MKWMLILVVASFVMAQSAMAEGKKTDEVKAPKGASANESSLFKILTGMNMKKEAKAGSDDISIPVDTSGTRGFEITGQSLSPVWPTTSVTPLRALSHNIAKASEAGESWSSMKLKLMEFEDDFPEFKNDPLLGELEALLTKGK